MACARRGQRYAGGSNSVVSVSDSDGDRGDVEHRQIVGGVTDRHDRAPLQPQIDDGGEQPGALVAAFRAEGDRTLVGDDPPEAPHTVADRRDQPEHVGRCPDHDVADVERRHPGSLQGVDQRRFGGLGEQREPRGTDVDEHATLLAHDTIGQPEDRWHDVAQFLPAPARDDDHGVSLGVDTAQLVDCLVGHAGAVEQGSVDVDGNHHLLHAPSYRGCASRRPPGPGRVSMRVRSGSEDGSRLRC